MNVRITIDLPAEKLTDLQAFLAEKPTESVPVPEEPDVVAAPSTTKPVKEPEPVAEKPAKADSMPVEKPAEPESKVTKSMIRAKGIEITKAGKQDQLEAVFKQFGAANLRAIDEADYEAVYKMLEAI